MEANTGDRGDWDGGPGASRPRLGREFPMSRARKPPIVTDQLNHALEEKVQELEARLAVVIAERDALLAKQHHPADSALIRLGDALDRMDAREKQKGQRP